MKKSIFLFAMILSGVFAYAQNTYNVVIFSEDGEPFFVYANGIRQNDKPETNVKITGLTSEALSMRVQFENKALPVLKQNFMPEFGYEHTVNIKKNLKKSMKLAYFGRVPLAEAPRTNAATVQYHTAENPVTPQQPAVVGGNVNGGTINNNFETDESSNMVPEGQQVNNTTVTNNGQPGSVNISVGPNGVNMNMQGIGGDITTTTTTSTTVVESNSFGTTNVSTTSSTTTPRSNKHESVTVKPVTVVTPTNPPASSSITPRPKNPNVQGTTAPTPTLATSVGCVVPMNDAEYEKLKNTIDDTPFADNKIAMAKTATKSNCLSVAQVKGICELMPMDDHKLTYAKYAYDYCTEKKNFYQVSEAFSFPTTTQKLNKFLQSK